MGLTRATVLTVAQTDKQTMVIFQPDGHEQMGVFFLSESHSIWKGKATPERGQNIYVEGLRFCPGPDIFLPEAAYPMTADNTEHRASVIDGKSVFIPRHPRTGYKTSQ